MIRTRDIRRYILYSTAMMLTTLGSGSYSLLPTGLYVALIFGGENPLILSLIYIASGLIVHPTLYSFIALIVPSLSMVITKLVMTHLHRRMTMLISTMLGVMSIIPSLTLKIVESGDIISGVMELILTAIFTYLSVISVYAIIVKRLRYRLSTDEVFASLVILLIMSAGIYSLDIYGFNIYYLIMPLVVLISVTLMRPSMAIMISAVYGLGGGIVDKNIELAGIILMMTLFCIMFMRYNCYFAVVSLVMIDLVGGVYFEAFRSYDYLHIIAVVVGAVSYLIIPKKVLKYEQNIYSNIGDNSAIGSFVRLSRSDINAKIDNIASLFNDIEEAMCEGEYVPTSKKWKSAVTERIMCSVCAECKCRDTCFKALGGDTMSQIEPIVEKAMLSKATCDDVSTFLESRCTRTLDMVDMANSLASKYTPRQLQIYDTLDAKRILGEEIGSIGKVLTHLNEGIMTDIQHDSERERRILEEMALVGIICHDVLVMDNRKGDIEVILVVRKVDKDKRAIREILESILHIQLERTDEHNSSILGFTFVRYRRAPKYVLSYGVATLTKDGSKASGDSSSVLSLGDGKVAIVLCDGKGSGERARLNSHTTIGIIEKMYRAGFESDDILAFTNRLLAIRNSEDFSAIDMCIVDLNIGTADFVKLGGVDSFIVRENSVDRVEGSSLPIGVLDEAKPSTSRRVLCAGDSVLIVSDGITDAMSGTNIESLLLSMPTSNVQSFADALMTRATEHGVIDDSTILCVRLSKV